MSTGDAGFVGEAPNVMVRPVPGRETLGLADIEKQEGEANTEQEKYEKMWSIDAYRNFAPGEGIATFFLGLAKPTPVDTVIDFGAGTGRGALMIALFGKGTKVHMVDFAENCLDEDVRNALTTQSHVLAFTKADVRKSIPVYAKYGYCTDVMEHIPPEDIDAALHNILRSAQHVFFQISTVEDHFGATIGEHLHLSVHPYQWWIDKLHEHEAVINWSQEQENQCAFYVTAWESVAELMSHGVLNTGEEEVRNNIQSSIARKLSEARPYEKTDIPVIILAGGPSMNEYEDEIKERRDAGEKLITVNGSYNWALARGIVPSATVVVDCREFNKRFVEPPVHDCRYLLASQCAPALFDAVPKDQTLLWHSAIDDVTLRLLEDHYLSMGTGQQWWPVLGGSTVMLRTLPLMVLLGYSRFEIYGFDSCLMGSKHHAYEQVENDGQLVLQVLVNGRTFPCHPWMVSQAQEFLDLMRLMAEHIELVVHGDGLIAWLIQTAADIGEANIEVVP